MRMCNSALLLALAALSALSAGFSTSLRTNNYYDNTDDQELRLRRLLQVAPETPPSPSDDTGATPPSSTPDTPTNDASPPSSTPDTPTSDASPPSSTPDTPTNDASPPSFTPDTPTSDTSPPFSTPDTPTIATPPSPSSTSDDGDNDSGASSPKSSTSDDHTKASSPTDTGGSSQHFPTDNPDGDHTASGNSTQKTKLTIILGTSVPSSLILSTILGILARRRYNKRKAATTSTVQPNETDGTPKAKGKDVVVEVSVNIAGLAKQ